MNFQPVELPIYVRPHDIEVVNNPTEQAASAMIERVIHLGKEIQADLVTPDGFSLAVYLSRRQYDQMKLQPGQEVSIKPKRTKVFAYS